MRTHIKSVKPGYLPYFLSLSISLSLYFSQTHTHTHFLFDIHTGPPLLLLREKVKSHDSSWSLIKNAVHY